MLSTRIRADWSSSQHPAQQFQAADARQVQIEQHEVRTLLPQPQQRVPSGRGLEDLRVRMRT